jgi:hypothetical protein
MPVNKTYSNLIDEVEVSLGIERLLIAPVGTAWTPARIDLSSIPAGFEDLGAVAEDTPSMKYSREKFQLVTGLPRTTQFQKVMSMEGSFECQLHSNSWRKLQYALGVSAVSSATAVCSISSVIATNQFLVSSGESLTVGRQYIVGGAGDFEKADTPETRITSVSTTGADAIVYVNPTPVSNAPAAGDQFASYEYVKQVYGGSQISYYKLLGVCDFVDQSQVVHVLHKCAPGEEITEEFRPDANARIPIMFDALGVETTIGGCTDLAVAERYYFPALTLC